jgi:hypothetical protein
MYTQRAETFHKKVKGHFCAVVRPERKQFGFLPDQNESKIFCRYNP